MVPPTIRFDGQAAIVTGVANGLGRGYALALAARGAAVVCNDVVADAAHAVAGCGRIVFTSSSAGLFGSPWQANDAAAKAGLVGLCNVVSLEGAAHGILANTILPMALTGIGSDGPPPDPLDVLRETTEHSDRSHRA